MKLLPLPKNLFLRLVVVLIGLAILAFIVMQAVPYGRDHANPRVTGEPAWDSPQTRALAKKACFDCHSNETTLAVVLQHRANVMAYL